MNAVAAGWDYEHVVRLINTIVLRFKRRFGGDFEELFSEANFHFTKAHETYDPEKGTEFTTWVGLIVYRGLMETKKKEIKRKGFLGEKVPLEGLEARPEFDLNELLRDLSEDASIVVSLLLETKANDKSKLAKILGWLGWSLARINESFAEITRVLTNG